MSENQNKSQPSQKMLRKLNLLIQLKSNHTRWMSSKAAKRLPIITCKNQELNLYLDDKPKKPEDIVLASKGWQHYKSKGDFFTIHPQRDVLESNFKDATSIDDIDVNEQIVKNAKEKHSIEKVTKLQKNVVDLALQEKHVLIAAQTGCGKVCCKLNNELSHFTMNHFNFRLTPISCQ